MITFKISALIVSISGFLLMAGGATTMFDWTQFGVVAAILGVQMWINHNTVKALTDAVNKLNVEVTKLNTKLDNTSREISEINNQINNKIGNRG